MPVECWRRAKGPRWYDWMWLPLAAPLQPHWRRWLLVRRSVSDPTELTAYVVFAPQVTVLATVVQVAGSRWTVERCFEEAKGEVGLISMKCGVGRDGIDISRWRCGRMRC